MNTPLLNIWGGGQLLAFSALDGPTSFEQGLVGRTSFDRVGIDIKLPGDCRLTFSDGPVQDLKLAGDTFHFNTSTGSVKGAFVDAFHLLVEGDCQVDPKSRSVAFRKQGARTLVGSAGHFQPDLIFTDLEDCLQKRSAWLNSILDRIVRGGAGAWPEGRQRTLAKALSIMKNQIYSPEGKIGHRWSTPDRWPHREMWLWDSAFHAIGWRHLDPGLARDLLMAVLDCQRKDGFIPHMMNPKGHSRITQPPVLALAACLVNDSDPEPGWLAAVYPGLAAYVRWDLTHRDRDGGGLVEWCVSGDPNCRSGESGMDNSSRFDGGKRLDAVDFNAFLALECGILAGFAGQLGRVDEAAAWQEQAERLRRLMNTRLWDPLRGFYFDYDPQKGACSAVMAGSGFLPLVCGAPDRAQAMRLAAHLTNPATFDTPLKIATIAAQAEQPAAVGQYYSKDMWCGPVWANLNWLVARGFRQCGMGDVAGELLSQTMAEIERFYEKYGTCFEFYDDRQEVDPPQLLRKGRCAPQVSPYHQVFHDYGWTATLYVDMALETLKI